MGSPHILVDARMMVGPYSGVSRYVEQLANQLAIDGGYRVSLLGGKEPPQGVTLPPTIDWVATSFSRQHRSIHKRLYWEERHLPYELQRIQPDLFHATWNHGIPWRTRIPSVLTIHDLIGLRQHQAAGASRWQRWCMHYALSRSAQRAVAIMTVSDFVASDVLHTLGVEPGKVTAIHNGVIEYDHHGVTTNDAWREPFVLYVGGHEPRKNVDVIIRTIHRYRKMTGHPLLLRMTGRRSSLSPQAELAMAECDGDAFVRLYGHVSDDELTRLYRCAEAVVMLSADEGFGLPAAEAIEQGCPVLFAPHGSLPEIVGSCGQCADPADVEACARALADLLAMGDVRERSRAACLMQRGRFSWHKTAVAVSAIYQRAMLHSLRAGNRKNVLSPHRTQPTIS